MNCPVCRSRDIRRSARRTLKEKLWSLAGRYPYRCNTCQTRFYALREKHRTEEEPPESEPPQPD